MSASESGQSISREEIASLPRWAQVAFAARCARRAQPVFQAAWPDALPEHVAALDRAITLTERYAAYPAAAARPEAETPMDSGYTLAKRRYRTPGARRWLTICFTWQTLLLLIQTTAVAIIEMLTHRLGKVVPERLRLWWWFVNRP